MCLGALRGEHSLKVARSARAVQRFPLCIILHYNEGVRWPSEWLVTSGVLYGRLYKALHCHNRIAERFWGLGFEMLKGSQLRHQQLQHSFSLGNNRSNIMTPCTPAHSKISPLNPVSLGAVYVVSCLFSLQHHTPIDCGPVPLSE